MGDNVALGEEIAEISGRVNVATHRLLTCVRRFDEAAGWAEQGAQSCAHWLTWRIGLDPATAREKVRVARALGALPQIDAAFATGRVSYAKVRAMTRVATAGNEAHLVEVALAATGAQLERICRGLRRATEPEVAQAADRRVRARALGNGLVKLEVVVTPDEADLLIRAIERARDRAAPARHTPSTDASSPSAPRPGGADALVQIAAAYLQAEDVSSERAPAPDSQVVIHLEADLGAPGGGLSASLDDGTHVSAETLRRVACDGGLVAAVRDAREGGVLDIGRRTRAIPTAIKRALWLRDAGCRFPGCANRRFVDGHHVRHWLHGGRTALDNLVLLCGFHHRLVHEGGFSIGLTGDGGIQVRTPSGALLPAVPRLSPDAGGVEWEGDWWTASDGFAPPPPTWTGDPVDYDEAVAILAAA